MDTDKVTKNQRDKIISLMDSGKITREDAHKILLKYVRPEFGNDFNRVRKVVGKNLFFGLDQWRKFLDEDFAIPDGIDTAIPWSGYELKDPMVKSPLFLFWGPSKIGDQPLDLHTLITLSQKIGVGFTDRAVKYIEAEYLNYCAQTCDDCWYMVPVGVNIGLNTSFDQQIFCLPQCFEPAHIIEHVVANILYHRLTGKFLYPDKFWVNSSEPLYRPIGHGDRVCLGIEDRRISIRGRFDFETAPKVGLAICRKSDSD